MLVCSAQKLAFIAVPKTGTTAIEMALRPRADIIFGKHRKHMTAQRFHRKVAPFLAEAFDLRPESMAIMRAPEEQIRSWYRYRTGERQKDTENSTFQMSFDEFVQDVISKDPPPHAGIGSQWKMLTGGGKVLINHLFCYESPPVMRAFLNDRFGESIEIGVKNVSPQAEAPLEPKTRAALRRARAEEYALYDRLCDAGGHLRTPLD